MNFKQCYRYFSWMDPIGEYALKFCFCLFNKKTLSLLLLLLLKKVSSARLGESDIHPISPKTPAPVSLIPEGHPKGNKSPTVLQGTAARYCTAARLCISTDVQPEHRV